MRIAVVSMIREAWGGSEELWADMAKKAVKQGHSVYHSTLVADPAHPKIHELLGIGVKQIPRRGLVRSSHIMPVRALLKIRNYSLNFFQNPFYSLLKKQPDVVLYVGTTYSIENDFSLVKALKKRGIKLFINCQLNFEENNLPGMIDRKKILKAFSYADKVLFVSVRNRKTAEKHLKEPLANAIIVRNPVNIKSKEIIGYPDDSNSLNLAMVGNLLIVHKGQDLVLEVLKKAQWLNRNWHLNIYGTGMDEEYLKKLCSDPAISKKVTFHGKVADIRYLWANNHLLIMPSLMEGMPLAVVEAMICGRPSVVTDVGGHTEWIAEGKEGFVADASSAQSIEKALERAWDNKDKWAQIGVAAHHKAMMLCDPDPGQILLSYLTKQVE